MFTGLYLPPGIVVEPQIRQIAANNFRQRREHEESERLSDVHAFLSIISLRAVIAGAGIPETLMCLEVL